MDIDNFKVTSADIAKPGQEPIVCAYGCVPQWPDVQLPRVERDELPVMPKQKVYVDIEEIENIICKIKGHKKDLLDIDITLSDSKMVMIDSFDGVNSKGIFTADSDTEIAKGIIELIKSHHENEIERLNKELVKLITG